MSEERCPNCGALVAADAEWCGLCLASLRLEPEPQHEPRPEMVVTGIEPDALTETPIATVTPGVEASEVSETTGDTDAIAVAAAGTAVPVWACPVCGNENPLEALLCPVCGTPFAKLFDEERMRPDVLPRDAAVVGLVPGMGHLKCGRPADGLARMFFAIASLAFAALFALSTSAGAASTVLTGLFVLLVIFSIAESSYDAFRLASGDRELFDARTMLWVFVGAFGLAVGLVVFLSLGKTGGGG